MAHTSQRQARPTYQQLLSFNQQPLRPPHNTATTRPNRPSLVVTEESFEQFSKAEREWQMKQDAWMLR